jgi:hypothetical protein
VDGKKEGDRPKLSKDSALDRPAVAARIVSTTACNTQGRTRTPVWIASVETNSWEHDEGTCRNRHDQRNHDESYIVDVVHCAFLRKSFVGQGCCSLVLATIMHFPLEGKSVRIVSYIHHCDNPQRFADLHGRLFKLS